MFKTIVLPFISFVLALTLLAAPVVPFLDKQEGKSMMYGSAEEEESGEKENAETKFDETIVFVSFYTDSSGHQIFQKQPKDFSGYLFPTSDHTVEILDPPPRKLI
ncbi:hypothetical protein [Flagellimonas crocea]|uniref:hypothetical protein n=1 Tax=Flagellimonas crocea TaxID=3067311 RepID=UPI00296F06E9|nr:hypothetical protein [Muricauda sp. DH64]